uniref:7TM_GPCR_Srx domain-containing protein n=1 Tax=Steinernema glaseri TaxID=37863 RepID=A0A1I7YM88_9BILA
MFVISCFLVNQYQYVTFGIYVNLERNLERFPSKCIHPFFLFLAPGLTNTNPLSFTTSCSYATYIYGIII